MSDVYSSQQVCEMFNLKDSTLRTWKSRKSDLLAENVHWLKSEDGSTLWTSTGIESLRQLCNGTVSTAETVAFQAETQPDVELITRYTPIVEAVSDAVSARILHQIDNAVLAQIKTHLGKPVNTNERISILSQLGLKPANPELLLQQSTTNYLPEGE